MYVCTRARVCVYVCVLGVGRGGGEKGEGKLWLTKASLVLKTSKLALVSYFHRVSIDLNSHFYKIEFGTDVQL